ncbi:gamma carbonic anhydrase family protein [Agromyces sp. LHK192]|uniref:gamma carbonic anhydrase family protein n=1 Tax=Agromyces sp. LHK192 TaxID=2498704 RepID=UPI000FD99437|nr:gamma carbonic anhydrase family protein [Agromyces sp. LHK192]
MSADAAARIIPLEGRPAPAIDGSAFVAPGAVIVGDVRLEAGSSVWYNSVLRAEAAPIVLGEGSNLQDAVVCHVDQGFPLTIGPGVSVGHAAVLHGCTIEADCLIGMSATVLNGAVIGEGSLVAAGAVVLEGTVVPPWSLVAGVPAKVRRELTDAERDGIRRNAGAYLAHRDLHATSLGRTGDRP